MDLNQTDQTIKEECDKLARFLYHLYKTNKELVSHVLEEKDENKASPEDKN